MEILRKENISLNQSYNTKEEAIRAVGQLLIDGGYVEVDYVEAMIERDKSASTYMGNNLAIPHGTEEAKKHVIETGISFVQVPDGVDFGKGEAKILVGIAGKGDDHLEILSQIAIFCNEQENIDKLIQANSEDEILDLLGGIES